MPATRDELLQRLAALGIATHTVDHPAVFTVAESDELESKLPGAHTKNLFLKDHKGALYLIVAESHARVDLKKLAPVIGSGRLSFGRPELLMEVLGVPAGSVTALSVINDPEGRVEVVIDATLVAAETVNCHPLINTATTNIAPADLLRFIRSTGHEPHVVALP